MKTPKIMKLKQKISTKTYQIVKNFIRKKNFGMTDLKSIENNNLERKECLTGMLDGVS
jgi:hypothetical protein